MAVEVLENTSRELPWSRKAELLSEFSVRIRTSGYNVKYRQNIIESAMKKWNHKLELDENGERPLYRHRTWKREEREKDKEIKKINWYRKGKRSDDTYDFPYFPIFCPATPNGELAKSWGCIAEETKPNPLRA